MSSTLVRPVASVAMATYLASAYQMLGEPTDKAFLLCMDFESFIRGSDTPELMRLHGAQYIGTCPVFKSLMTDYMIRRQVLEKTPTMLGSVKIVYTGQYFFMVDPEEGSFELHPDLSNRGWPLDMPEFDTLIISPILLGTYQAVLETLRATLVPHGVPLLSKDSFHGDTVAHEILRGILRVAPVNVQVVVTDLNINA